MKSNYNMESFHFSSTNHQKIDKEFITILNNKGQLKIFYFEQRKSKCILKILFMMGQPKTCTYEIYTMNQ